MIVNSFFVVSRGNLTWVALFLFMISSCGKQEVLVIRADIADPMPGFGFDSINVVDRITGETLKSAGHLLIGSPVHNLDFNERNAVERYLEAGGLVTFTCRDTIYNWGQLLPFFESGQAQIKCEEGNMILTRADLNYSKARTPIKPGTDRLIREVLVAPLREPICMAVTERSLIYWIERKGTINVYDPGAGESKEIDKLDVYTGEEDGLLGLVLDPDFQENQWAYVFYSPPGSIPKQHVSRFRLTPEGLDRDSEIVIIEIPTQREECCHSAGDLEIDKMGNLYISTGDNTFSRASDGFTPLDERPGRSAFDSQKSSPNTNDLRGKILRIHPEQDGSYTIPEGNLFPKDGSEGRPEIYIMGARNPFTIALNKDRDWLYWGDVGPDGNVTSERGPSAHDELNFAKKPGNYGWPYFNANNLAYADYDFATGELGPRFDPEHPRNTSVNNTGKVELPPAVPAMVYYTFDETEQFPGVGKGSRSIGVGEVYNYAEMQRHGYEFPEYYHHKLFIFDWARDWIMVISQDEEGNFLSIEPFLDNTVLASPIDMTFGPDGSLYVLEYGIGYFTDNRDSRLIRLDFVYGNRPPEAKSVLSVTDGAVPLKVAMSGTESTDPDLDALKCSWTIEGPEEFSLTGSEAEVVLTAPGEYTVSLNVQDPAGTRSIVQSKIIAGNTSPQLDVRFEDNQTFYWPGRPIRYTLKVNDAEDGAIGSGIDPGEVHLNLTKYEGSDNRAPASLAILDGDDNFAPGLQLISKSDCKSCHKINEKSIGPSFYEIAERYDKDYIAVELLAGKIINGGSGVWGNGAMIAHPDFSIKAAKQIVEYIFTVNDPVETMGERIDVSGAIATKNGEKNKYRFEAAYTDRGGVGAPGLSATEEVTLIPPVLEAENADYTADLSIMGGVEEGDARFLRRVGDFPAFGVENVDLSNISGIELDYFFLDDNETTQPVSVELRLDDRNGGVASAAVISPAKKGRQCVLMEINAAEKHDLYFAFKSENTAFRLGIDKLIFNLNH